MADGFDRSLLDGAALAPSEAISFFRQKALVPTERYGEVMNEAHSVGFSVAGAASQALLTDLKTAVNRALTDGTTLHDFRQDFDRIVAKNGWQHGSDPAWRAKIIYNTNLATAYAAGQYAQLATEEARDIFPAWRYRHHACAHPRPEHVAWDGMVLANDDPWWDTHFPPNGWHCHCTVEPVTRSQLKRNNWTISEAPPLDLRPWKNPATGRTEMVPKGIDPSFAYNPGKAWLENQKTRTALQPKLEPRPATPPTHQTAPADRQAQQVKDVEALLKPGAHGEVTAGTMPADVQHVLGSETADVILSDDTLNKNIKHGEVEGHYVDLPGMISAPGVVLPGNTPRHVRMVTPHQGKLFNIVVKRTGDGTRNYLQSFQRISLRDVRRWLRKNSPLFGGDIDFSDFER